MLSILSFAAVVLMQHSYAAQAPEAGMLPEWAKRALSRLVC